MESLFSGDPRRVSTYVLKHTSGLYLDTRQTKPAALILKSSRICKWSAVGNSSETIARISLKMDYRLPWGLRDDGWEMMHTNCPWNERFAASEEHGGVAHGEREGLDGKSCRGWCQPLLDCVMDKRRELVAMALSILVLCLFHGNHGMPLVLQIIFFTASGPEPRPRPSLNPCDLSHPHNPCLGDAWEKGGENGKVLFLPRFFAKKSIFCRWLIGAQSMALGVDRSVSVVCLDWHVADSLSRCA